MHRGEWQIVQIIQLPQSFGYDRTLDYSDNKLNFTQQESFKTIFNFIVLKKMNCSMH